MATLASDNFTGTNGTTPAAWTISSGSGVIGNNRFQIAGAATGTYATGRALRDPPAPLAATLTSPSS